MGKKMWKVQASVVLKGEAVVEGGSVEEARENARRTFVGEGGFAGPLTVGENLEKYELLSCQSLEMMKYLVEYEYFHFDQGEDNSKTEWFIKEAVDHEGALKAVALERHGDEWPYDESWSEADEDGGIVTFASSAGDWTYLAEIREATEEEVVEVGLVWETLEEYGRVFDDSSFSFLVRALADRRVSQSSDGDLVDGACRGVRGTSELSVFELVEAALKECGGREGVIGLVNDFLKKVKSGGE